MAEDRVVETMFNFDFEFPEPTIQRIQSFLTGKEAAHTCILSKSWHSAWLTRPNLDFESTNCDELLALAKKTIQRYEDSNLKIESFSLKLKSRSYVNKELANILIVKALKLCASHLSIEIYSRGFFIAPEVFGSENLVGLSVEGCGIDLGLDHTIRCYKLESLCLRSVETENHDVIPNIISSCPLIRNLSLSHLVNKNRYGEIRINLPKMHDLKCLTLDHVKPDSLFFDLLSSKFPSLTYLTLAVLFPDYHSDDDMEQKEEGIRISSPSLEQLNLTLTYWASKFKFDVPSIKKLVIKACSIPTLSFESTSKVWESHVSLSLEHKQPLNNAWFLELNCLLTALSPSIIDISIDGGCDKCFDYEVRVNQGLRKHKVENLNINIEFLQSLNCYALFDGLFRFCRPNFITHQYQYRDPYSEHSRTNINDFISKKLEQGTKGLFSSPEIFMYGLNDLKEVYVQIFYEEDDVADLPWKPLKEVNEATGTISLEPRQKIRFQLVWKS